VVHQTGNRAHITGEDASQATEPPGRLDPIDLSKLRSISGRQVTNDESAERGVPTSSSYLRGVSTDTHLTYTSIPQLTAQ
jgi:hypothetical protein